jgi:hypothetical protein
VLNASALIDLPGNVQVGFISAFASRSPVMPYMANVDLDGDGTTNTAIPGVDEFNCFNFGCGKDDLAQAVSVFNQRYAGQRDARGQVIAPITLPADYQFGDSFSSQDLRVTKTFNFDQMRLAVFVEGFNIFNVANLGGYSYNLSNTATFGQPTNRASQVFGSGGPRAFQLGGRFTF